MRNRYLGFPKGDGDYLFVTHEGRAMVSKQISGSLRARLKGKGISKGCRMQLRFSVIPMYYADRFISKSVLKEDINMFLLLLYLPALISVVQHKKA